MTDQVRAQEQIERSYLDDLDAAKKALAELIYAGDVGDIDDLFRVKVNRAVDALADRISTWDALHRVPAQDEAR